MKIKDGFVLKEIAGSHLVVPLGTQVVNFGAMIKLNETGAFLWDLLQDNREKEELVSSLLSEYDVEEAKAIIDVDGFINKLKDADLLE
ncbi:MAG: PqqD family protein [Ruminococcus sp.]|nr:PqqD family protein [Ruminococcus sp.]